MPSNFTENYQLSQWEAADKVQRADFNSDNAKIDAAIKAQADARAALAATVAENVTRLSKLEKLKIETFTYTGNGQEGASHPTVLTFSRQPLFFLIFSTTDIMLASPFLSRQYLNITSGFFYAGFASITWNGNQVSFYSDSQGTTFGGNGINDAAHQMNGNGFKYVVAAVFAEE